MAKSIIATKKPKGRPVSGIGTPVQVRLDERQLQSLDAWRKKQLDLPTRPEAIRRLVEAGLKGTKV